MAFTDDWNTKIDVSLADFADLAFKTDGIDFIYGWLATGILWPVKDALATGDPEAMAALREIAGSSSPLVADAARKWADDRTAAGELALAADRSADLRRALDLLLRNVDGLSRFAAALQRGISVTVEGDLPEMIRNVLVTNSGLSSIGTLDRRLSSSAATAKTTTSTASSRPEVFISYSRKDADIARELHRALSDERFSLWRDRAEMKVGVNWWEQIQQAISTVHTLRLLLSPHARESKVRRQQRFYSLRTRKRV